MKQRLDTYHSIKREDATRLGFDSVKAGCHFVRKKEMICKGNEDRSEQSQMVCCFS